MFVWKSAWAAMLASLALPVPPGAPAVRAVEYGSHNDRYAGALRHSGAGYSPACTEETVRCWSRCGPWWDGGT